MTPERSVEVHARWLATGREGRGHHRRQPAGFGLAIARSLASEACNVVISGRNQQTVERAATEIRHASLTDTSRHQPKVLALECDVRDNAAVERMFATVAREFGQLDILVNNAGISQSAAPVGKTDVELWRDIIDVNLTGTFLCTRAAMPLLKSGGTILNIISVAARESAGTRRIVIQKAVVELDENPS